MAIPGHLWHAALGSGEASREPCGYSAAQLDAWRGHLDSALETGKGELIPGKQGYAMSARTIGDVLLCTVGRVDDTTPLCSFAVVQRPQEAQKAWEALHKGYPQFAGSLGKVPKTPYCAVRAEVGLIYDQAAGAWLDGYQLAIAWAWIVRRRAGA